jgi:hypothetical protein
MEKSFRLHYRWTLIALALSLLCNMAFAETGNITVAWDPIQDLRLAGYTVVWGQSSQNYSSSQNTSATELTLQLAAGKKYYFAVRGYDKEGTPGELSAEVSSVIKGSSNNDNTPPVISNVSVSGITSSSATITFTTNEQAYVQMEYGKSSNLGTFTGLTNVSATSHAVPLIGLSNSTNYYCRVIATDLSGNEAKSTIFNFQTKDGSSGNGDPNATLKIIQIALTSVTSTTVTINWTTNKAATALFEYGKGNSLDRSLIQTTSTTDQTLSLVNLEPSTVYHYRITASRYDGDVTSGILMFKTADRVNQLAQPSSDAIYLPSVVESTNMRTNLGIDNLADSTANVNVTLVGKDGLVIAEKTVQVSPKGLTQINRVISSLAQVSSDQGVAGSLYLESDQPISGWVSQIDNATNDPSLLTAKHSGSARILIPSSANTSKFTSSLVIMNLGTTQAQVSLKAHSVDGSILGETHEALTISPNGILTFENVLQSLGINENYGPIEITSLDGNPLIAASRVSSKNRAGGFFEGVDYSEASLNPIIPHVVDTAELRTNLGIDNVTEFFATVIIRLMNKDGQEVGAKPVTVAPKGLTQVGNVIRQLLGTADVTNLEGYLRLESNQPIIAWVSEIDNNTNDPGFAVSKNQGATHLMVGSTTNVGVFKSSLVVVNTGDADASVDIVMRDTQGTVQGAMNALVIPAHGFYSTQSILESLGVSENFGPVELISANGQPLVVVSRVYSNAGTSGFFEGLPLE